MWILGHQHANAAYLVDAGGAVVLDQERSDALPAVVAGLLGDPARLDRMGRAAAAVGYPRSADDVAGRMVEAHRG